MLFPLFVIVGLDPPFWPGIGIGDPMAAVSGVGIRELFTAVAVLAGGALVEAVAGVGSAAPDTALSLEVG